MKRPQESVVDGSKASTAAPPTGPAALPKDLPALDRLLRQPTAAALLDMAQWGLPREPLPQEKLAAGCDVVSFSGDKLLSGPQAVIGRAAEDPVLLDLRCLDDATPFTAQLAALQAALA